MEISANTSSSELKSIKVGDYVADARYEGYVSSVTETKIDGFTNYQIVVEWKTESNIPKRGVIYAKR